ncbi:hypothetical protein A2867_03590 [Candidatus Daviesbacteria bacterium RIFCSPHIGHO2_01_FULL_40_11]|uniref:Membrane protein 6-pyruvoyl-tetrahydropterin synthase-related domain-containing protein n=1 Tax=Candidatus Daviesbacteria bacterium RIFCSPHIGHO2_01_FULL_40_11 TaxID=1797762 RepID=A0A1F5JKD1_9BACT|nr:MAG: hypothetical protein A2867_03590 [Candidatus Daviesbacteria bacterium RIFCSPHIGHO2_01_FULL_40_11]OGE62779.1 MAG: hypothetical protein A2964_01685 [Candidatus Daviesbacteria bacterium RIFCSPLOWO2_01_FULL_40_27]
MLKYFFSLILICFSVFWIWWLPGPRVANDFSFVSNDWLKLQFDVPRAWNERGAEGLGEYGVFTLWSYPVNLIFGALPNLGLNFQIWERILVILFISLGSLSIWKFLSQYPLSNKAKFIGSLFYLINTYPILLIDGGQISIALAYALFPFAFLQVSKAVYSGLRKRILAGIVVSFLGFFDIRFLYILFLLLFIKAVFDVLDNRKVHPLETCWKWINTGGVIILLVVSLNAYWLIAYLKVPIEGNIFSSFTNISASLLNIGHPLLVISPHWYKNVFGQISQLKAEFILLPILAFIAPILSGKDKAVSFWLIVTIFSIFLAKGGSEPLSFVYPWFHANIPGFSFFRDSTKFFFAVTLSYAVLISISSEEIFRILKKIRSATNGEKLAALCLPFITVYLLYLVKPIFLNQMTGTFSIQPVEKQFQSLTNVLQNDKTFGRVFWIPTTAPLSYSDLNHPIVEAARVFNRMPFVFGVKGTYETFNFLREAPYTGEIFDIAAISYIAYPFPDTRRENLSFDEINYYDTFLKQLSNLSWIEKKVEESRVPILKVKNHQDKIFLSKNSWIVFGSDEIFNEATKSAELKLANNAIIFAEEKPEIGSLLTQFPEAKIVLNRKTNTDLVASFIPASKIIFPADKLTTIPDKTGWWKNDGRNLISWRDFLQTKYSLDSKEFDLGGGWAVGEGKKEFTIYNLQFTKGKILLARVMESSRSGGISFYQDGELIGGINTLKKDTLVRWYEIGRLGSSANLIIKTEGDINIVNVLAIVDPNDLANYEQKAKDSSNRVAKFSPENVDNQVLNVSYKKINQTKYQVLVSGLTSPSLIVFSSTFHPGWKLDGKSATAVYGFLNGFRVVKDGEYILEFEPQKYIRIGLVVSLLSFILIMFLLLTLKKPQLK